jgi:hypothetical protein
MQEALEAGQLDRVADMLGLSPIEVGDMDQSTTSKGDSNEEENYYDDFEEFEEDSC